MAPLSPKATRNVTDVTNAATVDTRTRGLTDCLDAVIHGDSREVVRGLPDESVHAIVSDIPYGIGVEDWDVLHSNQNSAYRGSSPAQETAGAVFRARRTERND